MTNKAICETVQNCVFFLAVAYVMHGCCYTSPRPIHTEKVVVTNQVVKVTNTIVVVTNCTHPHGVIEWNPKPVPMPLLQPDLLNRWTNYPHLIITNADLNGFYTPTSK